MKEKKSTSTVSAIKRSFIDPSSHKAQVYTQYISQNHIDLRTKANLRLGDGASESSSDSRVNTLLLSPSSSADSAESVSLVSHELLDSLLHHGLSFDRLSVSSHDKPGEKWAKRGEKRVK